MLLLSRRSATINGVTTGLIRENALVGVKMERQVEGILQGTQILLEVSREDVQVNLGTVVDAGVDDPRASDINPRADTLNKLCADARGIVAGAVLAHEDG